MKQKKIKQKILLLSVAFICIGFFIRRNLAAIEDNKLSETVISNVEALTNDEREPEWWDYFNNYIVEERIPITTQNCTGGILKFGKLSVSVGSCSTYSYAVIGHCYDGGHRDECTSSKVLYYI